MWLEEIFKGGTAGIFEGVKGLIQTVKADPLEILKLQAGIDQAEMQFKLGMAQAQTKVNEIEAASGSFFKSGWRPATGWSCVGGLTYQVILRPIAQSVMMIWHPEYAMVSLEIETLMTLLFGMLGLGAYRTYEKVSTAK